MLRSDLCDYSDVYRCIAIVAKKRIPVIDTTDANGKNKKSAFKNNAPFSYQGSITYFLDNVEDLNIVMSMYNLLEYSGNYSMTSESLWNYFRDEVNDNANENK